MKLSLYLVFAIAQGAVAGIFDTLFPRATCEYNNCNRAVTSIPKGTKIFSEHIADCSSFFSTTVYSNISSTVTPTLIPTYATAGCGENGTLAQSKYSTACSCAGVTGTVVTESSPVCCSSLQSWMSCNCWSMVNSGMHLVRKIWADLNDKDWDSKLVISVETRVVRWSGVPALRRKVVKGETNEWWKIFHLLIDDNFIGWYKW